MIGKIRLGGTSVNIPEHLSFQELWRIQQIQQDEFVQAGINQRLHTRTIVDEMTSKRALQMIEEIVELVRHTGYKEHRCVTSSPSSEYDARLEWADIFKYLLIIAQIRGWSIDECMEAFVVKTVVADSYMRERMLVDNYEDEWIAFDIDDVIADYTGHFCFEMEKITGRHIDPIDIDHTKSIGEQYGVDRKDWEIVKQKVRGGGGFLEFETIPGGVEAVNLAKFLGFKVLLITNRPVHEYPRLYSDTVMWLAKHSIPYDSLIFGSSKVMKICQDDRKLANKIKLAFDDHPQNIRDFKDVGINAILVSARENDHDGVVTLDAMAEYIRTILGPR